MEKIPERFINTCYTAFISVKDQGLQLYCEASASPQVASVCYKRGAKINYAPKKDDNIIRFVDDNSAQYLTLVETALILPVQCSSYTTL